jgi:Domain of unknown function (DUF5666)
VSWRRISIIIAILSFFAGAGAVWGQDQRPQQDQQGQEDQQTAQPGRSGGQGRRWQQDGQRPIFGKIAAIKDGTIELTQPDGGTLVVKLTDKTEFRKDRQPAKAEDFKVGDFIIVRGEENPDKSVTAQMIAARTGGAGGPGGGGREIVRGELGKDFVVGEVKAIDPPQITVVRTDNVTQTLELNEDTSLRKGRQSITMADIQVGDHLMARGAVENNVFVPKGVMIFSAEQWKRMQEMGMMMRQGQQGGPQKPAAPEQQPKPQEQPN